MPGIQDGTEQQACNSEGITGLVRPIGKSQYPVGHYGQVRSSGGGAEAGNRFLGGLAFAGHRRERRLPRR